MTGNFHLENSYRINENIMQNKKYISFSLELNMELLTKKKKKKEKKKRD